MEESLTSSSTTMISHDNIEDDNSYELNDMNKLLPSDSMFEGLNDSRSELLTHVQSLKKDLEDWREKLDIDVNSDDDDVGDLKFFLNSNVEQLTNEFQGLKDTLKEQLAMTTSKLVELDTSVFDCAQYLEGLSANCDMEKSLFDDLVADLKLQTDGKREKQAIAENISSAISKKDEELLDRGSILHL